MSDGADEPSRGEIVRRLDRIDAQQAEILRELKADRAEVAKTYVRQDVYLAQRKGDAAVLADLHGDLGEVRREREKDIAWRRQVLLWLGGITITLLLGIAGLVVSLVR